MESKSIIIGVIVVLVLAIGGYFIYQTMNKPAITVSDNQQTTNNEQASQQQPQAPTETIIIPDQSNTITLEPSVQTSQTHEVIYTDSGFSPATLTIKVGDTVTFKNQSSGGQWVASAMHPTHTVYSNTTLQQHCPDPDNNAFDQCRENKTGESWSFTFTKAGSWAYHNHVNSTKYGTIIVK